MAQYSASDYERFEKGFLPDLFKTVVAIAHENDDGDECIGSGVLIVLNGRHFIATAKHCIEHDPRVFSSDFYMLENKEGTKVRCESKNTTRIIKQGLHATLDIGYLEVPTALASELTEDQLCFATKMEGMVHVVGHPACRIERDPSKRTMILSKCAFGTGVTQITGTNLILSYPVNGVRSDGGQWVSESFPDPHGFSGGGCYGISRTERSGLEIIEYKLLGIQCSWCEPQRIVNVVPIKQWHDLVKPVL